MVNRKIAIIGATSSIAEHCARLWAQTGSSDFTLVVRNRAHGEAMRADLLVRSPKCSINVLEGDFLDPRGIAGLVDTIFTNGPIDTVLIAHGLMLGQEDCQRNLEKCNDALTVNGISPVLFAEAFAGKMAEIGHGTIAVIGSVAGDRGRKSNYIYGAGKSLIEKYLQGMRHRFFGTGINIVLIKPGPTRTPMTSGIEIKGGKLAEVEKVAADIVRHTDRGDAVIYTPAKWRLIMCVIRNLPNIIFNKLNI